MLRSIYQLILFYLKVKESTSKQSILVNALSVWYLYITKYKYTRWIIYTYNTENKYILVDGQIKEVNVIYYLLFFFKIIRKCAP